MKQLKFFFALFLMASPVSAATVVTWNYYSAPTPSSCLSYAGTPCYWPLMQGFGKISPDGVNGGVFVPADRQTSGGTVTVTGGTNVAWVSGDQFGAQTWALGAGDTMKINGTSYSITQGSVTATSLTLTSAAPNGTWSYTAGGGGSTELTVFTDVYNWSTSSHSFSYFGGNATLTQNSGGRAATLETDDPTFARPADRQQEMHQLYDSTRGAIWLTGGLAAGHYWNCMTTGGVNCNSGSFRSNVMWRMDLATKAWTSITPTHRPVDNLSATQGSAIDTDDQIILQAGNTSSLGAQTSIYCPTDKNPTPGTLTANQISAGCIQTSGADDWCAMGTSGQGCTATTTGTLPALDFPSVYYVHSTGKFYAFMGLVGGTSTVNNHVYSYSPLTRVWAQADTGTGCPMSAPSTLTAFSLWTAAVAKLSNDTFLYHDTQATTADWIFDPATGNCTQATTVGTGPSYPSHGATMAQDSTTGRVVSWFQGGTDVGVWEATISAPPTITTTSPLTTGAQYTPYAVTLAATNSPTSWAITAGSLPTGIALNTSTGVISGKTSLAGSWSVTIKATNSTGDSAPATFTLPIAAGPGIGNSTTACIDVDGDGYGVGPSSVAASDLSVSSVGLASTGASVGSGAGLTPMAYVSGGTSCTSGVQTVTFIGGGGTGASGTMKVSGGVPIGTVWITSPGTGYTSVPTSIQVSTCTGTTTVTGGSLASTVSSASNSFQTYDIGRNLTITSGTGFVPGVYTILATVSGAAELNSQVATVGTSGGSYSLPGCLGPDADDTDATVHSSSDALTKYGTLAAFWSHLGWTPAHAVFVDGGSGTCTPVSSPFTYSSATACATVQAGITAMAAGDAVVVRGGTYSQAAQVNLKSGLLSGTTCTGYSYHLAYPGELPDLEYNGDVHGMGFAVGNQSCFVVDGFRLHQSCLQLGTCGTGGYGIRNSGTVYGMTLSHNDVSGFSDELFPQFNQFGTQIVYNFMHEALAGGDFGHVIYLGSNCPGLGTCTSGAQSANTVIRANIMFNSMDTCIHANGPMTNVTFDSNLIWGCNSPILFQNGTNHSTIQNNVIHTSGNSPLGLGTYANSYSTQQWQCHDQNYNTFRHNTFFMDGQNWKPSYPLQTETSDPAFNAIYVVDDGSCQAQAGYTPDLGNNIYDNNILVHSCGTNCTSSSGYIGSVLRFAGTLASTYLQTSTYRNNVINNFDVSTRIIDPLGTVSFQPCSWFTNTANVPLASGNLCGSNPLFTAANPQWNFLPASWNLSVAPGSPAIQAAYAADAAGYDIFGVPRSALPTIGAYEFGAASATALGGKLSVGGNVKWH